MPTFEEQYFTLFGKEYGYDPIDTDAPPAPRVDLSLDAAGESTGLSDLDTKVSEFMSGLKKLEPPKEEPGLIGDVGRALGAGTVQVGSLAVGGAEYLARQAAADESTSSEKLVGRLIEPLAAARRGIDEYAQDIIGNMSEQSQNQIAKKFATLDPDQSIWRQNPLQVARSVGLQVAQTLPAQIVTLLPAVRLFRAGMTTGGLTYLTASEAGLSVAEIANGITAEIESMTSEELNNESQMYRDLYNEGYNDEEIRRHMIQEAQGAAPILGGAIVAGISLVGGKFLQPIISPSADVAGAATRRGFASRAAGGFAVEAPQEALQGGAENIAQNIAAQLYDANRSPVEGLGEAMFAEGFLGGIAGGAITSVAGGPPPTKESTEVPTEPEGGDPTEPGRPVAASEQVPETLTEDDESLPDPINTARDLTAPVGVVTELGELDPFSTGEPGQPDTPSAEPVADVEAQIAEMIDPQMDRQAVFFSPDSLANLQEQGRLPSLLKQGVPMVNFDGEGGLLLARDKATADELVTARDFAEESGQSIESVLGLATTAGTGKPEFSDDNLVVQRRDKDGNVVQESLVADTNEAEALVIDWKRQHPEADIVSIGAPQALQRREMLIDRDRVMQNAELARADRADELQAAQLLGEAATEGAVAERGRIGGFYPPSAMQFQDAREEVKYANRFDELLDLELQKEQGTLTPQASERRGELLEELATIRQAAKPKLRTDKKVRKARAVSPRTVKEAEEEAKSRATRKPTGLPAEPKGEYDTDLLQNLTDSQIDNLQGEKLDAVFSHAANYLAGRLKGEKVLYVGTTAEAVSLGEQELLAEAATEVRAKAEPLIEITEMKRGPGPDGMKGVWTTYTLTQGKEVTKGTVRGTVKVARDKLQATVDVRNAKIKKANAQLIVDVTPKQVLTKFETPSEKRKLIRRVKNQLVGKEHGGKSRSKPVTKSSTKSKTQARVHKRKGKFNVTVLADERLPKDESRVDRIKRVLAAKTIRSKLNKTTRRIAKHMDRVRKGTYAKAALERDKHGNLTEEAKAIVHGLAYFRMVADFAVALDRSKNKSLDAIVEMEKVNKFLVDAMKMSHENFGRVMGNLLKAESQTQVLELRGFTDLVKANLADPAKREAMNAKIQQENMRNTAALYTLEVELNGNPYWNNIVHPIIIKFAQSSARDGYPSYKPTEEEMTQLSWVLDNWRIPRLRQSHYTPIRRFLSNSLGFQWTKDGTLIIPRDEAGKYNYSPSDTALQPRYAAQFGKEAESITPTTQEQYYTTEVTPQGEIKRKYGRRIVPGTLVADASAAAPLRTEAQDVTADRAAELEEYGMRMQANRIIEQVRDIVKNPRTTIAGLLRTETRFIEAMKTLGMWQDVSPRFGKIKQRTARRYQIIGPRLEAKTIDRETARAQMLTGLKTESIPKDLARDDRIQARGRERVSAGDISFLEVTNPQPSDMSDFQDTSIAITKLLDQTDTPTDLNEVLDIIVAGLPVDHIYHQTALKIRMLGMEDVPISWDLRGALQVYSKRDPGEAFGDLKKDKVGAARWFDDPQSPTGQSRYIVLNRALIQEQNDPSLLTLHTVLHEATHVATQGAMDSNVHIREAVRFLRDEARKAYVQENGPTDWNDPDSSAPYGLRSPRESEFVAEAFSNIRFQNRLKLMPVDTTMTAWQKFVHIVKNVLGIAGDRPSPTNMLEAIMDLEHVLFTGEGNVMPGQLMQDAYMEMDPTMRETARAYLEPITGNFSSLKDGWKTVKDRITAPLSLMSMRQITGFYEEHFGGTLKKYTTLWGKRDAENTRLMKQGEDIIRKWTVLTERQGVAPTLEFSRIKTEATLEGIDPTVPLQHKNNEHLMYEAQHKKHAELSARYEAMLDEHKTLWRTVSRYYETALQEETNLVMYNALRATLTSRKGALLTAEQFDKAHSIEGMVKLTTPEALEEAFPGLLTEEQAATVLQMSSIPTLRKGPYSPLMRYGDYVVYSSRVKETRAFTTPEEAGSYKSELLASDPTLDITVNTEHVMTVVEKDFRTFETRSEAATAEAEMIEEYGRDATSNVQKKDKFNFREVAPEASGLNNILDALEGNPAAQAAMKDWWLGHLRDSSFRKHEISRKNRRGADYDLQHRNFAQYVKKSSYYRAHLKYGWQMAQQMDKIKAFVKDYKESPGSISSIRLGEVRDHLIKREAMVADMTEVGKWQRKVTEMSQVYMLVGPSFWLINSSQPWLVSLPWMAARHKGAFAAMKNAQKLIASPLVTAMKDSRGGFTLSKEKLEEAFNVLDQVKAQIAVKAPERSVQYNAMLESLREHNVMDLSWIAELRDISEGTDLSTRQKMLDGSRVMAHLTEVNNRIFTGIAAYDLEYESKIAKGFTHEAAHEAGTEFAMEAVATTHFDYSAGNKPLLFQSKGPLGSYAPLVFQFMQYPQHIYAMMLTNMHAMVKGGLIERKVARRTLLGILGANIAVAGTMGIALQPLKIMVGMTMLAFGADDDETTFAGAMSGEAYEREHRKIAADLFGPKLGHAVSRGVPAALGLDVSDRLALGAVYFLDLRTDTAESTIGSIVTSMGGAWLTMGTNIIAGAGRVLDGDPVRGIEQMMPKMIRDLIRAGRYAGNGVVNNAGDTILDGEGLTPIQLFFQAMGFTPTEISELYAKQMMIKDVERYGTDRRGSLLRHFRTARSVSDRQAIMEEIRAFNRAFPHAAITRSALIRAVQGKAEREANQRRFGANLRGPARILGRQGDHYLK